MHFRSLLLKGTLVAGSLLPVLAVAQLRVASWNVTNYGSSSTDRTAAFQTCFYGVFENRSLAPDVLICQEFLDATAVTNFRNLLNTATNSPGDWASIAFVNGPDTDSTFFYRTSKVEYLGYKLVHGGGNAPEVPRNVMRYDFRPVGYPVDEATMAIYSSHMKSGSTTSDIDRRILEAQYVRTDAQSLNSKWSFLIGGDFNILTSSEVAYQGLVGSQANNAGRFFDPINRPGSWNNNATYRNVHTQDPASQMDDRFDQLLISQSLFDNKGLDYIGNPSIAFKAFNANDPKPWDDPNHSYHCWGNDAYSFNAMLRTTGNTMVGPTIAQALIDTANGNGHLPVYLDLKVPADCDTSTTYLDFGLVDMDQYVALPFDILNSANTSLWTTDGIANLNYTMASTTGVTVPAGSFSVVAGSSRQHNAVLNTATSGLKSGTITISSDAPNHPTRVINWSAIIVGKVNGKFPRDPRYPGGFIKF
ncbi:MAG: hypothetical protein JST40_11645 [Armatimonadetes bacterium]|nr:hypothetical protein [Armatimonadota bacterium]